MAEGVLGQTAHPNGAVTETVLHETAVSDLGYGDLAMMVNALIAIRWADLCGRSSDAGRKCRPVRNA